MFLDQVQKALDKQVAGNHAPVKKGELVAKPVMQALQEAYGSTWKAEEMYGKIANYLNNPNYLRAIDGPHKKSLGTVDISALRLVSLSDRVAVQRNEETKFLNYLESKGDMPPILDYQFRIKERNIVTDVATKFNIDSVLPPFQQSSYNQRYNTLTAIGDTLKVSFMASSIAEQQADVNILEEQIDDEIVRIRRTFNSTLLSNIEQVSEAAGSVPQMHGFVTASTINTLNAGGGNLTNTLIQGAANLIGATLGFAHQFTMWTTVGQEPIVRDLMINRFPGENSAAFNQSMAESLKDRLNKYNVPVDVAYRLYPGGTMPSVYDTQMPANTALVFCGEHPRLARFKMDGMVGPFVLARPEQTLYEVVAVFDLGCLDDPLQAGRVVISNLES